jgi:uncharacterized protein
VVGVHNETIKLQVTAPPVGGAANAAVADVLAKWLRVPRRSVSIVHGQSGRDKVVMITTPTASAVGALIESELGRPAERRSEPSTVVDKRRRCD